MLYPSYPQSYPYLVAHPTNRKWVITCYNPSFLSELTLLIPFITGVITHLRAVGWSTKYEILPVMSDMSVKIPENPQVLVDKPFLVVSNPDSLERRRMKMAMFFGWDLRTEIWRNVILYDILLYDISISFVYDLTWYWHMLHDMIWVDSISSYEFPNFSWIIISW